MLDPFSKPDHLAPQAPPFENPAFLSPGLVGRRADWHQANDSHLANANVFAGV